MAEDAGDDIRSRSVTLLSTSLSTAVSHAGAAADQSQLEQLAAAIEEATFDSQGAQTGNEYRNAVREKSLVLKKDNPDIVQQLISGKMTPKTFAQATAAVSTALGNCCSKQEHSTATAWFSSFWILTCPLSPLLSTCFGLGPALFITSQGRHRSGGAEPAVIPGHGRPFAGASGQRGATRGSCRSAGYRRGYVGRGGRIQEQSPAQSRESYGGYRV